MDNVIEKHPTIDTRLLINLSKAGRSVLAYIIDNSVAGSKTVKLDKLNISNYIATHIGKKEANTWNVERGIKDLVFHHVIKRIDDTATEFYFINTKLLSK